MFRLRQTSTLSLFMAAAVSSAFIVTTTSSLPVFDEIYNTVFDQVQEEQRNADLLEADADYDRFFERLLDDTSFGCTADSCPGGDFCNFDDGMVLLVLGINCHSMRCCTNCRRSSTYKLLPPEIRARWDPNQY